MGVTAIDAKVGVPIVSVTFELIAPNVATMVTVPMAPPIVVASPVVLLIVAEPVPFILFQVTELVRSCVEPSV